MSSENRERNRNSLDSNEESWPINNEPEFSFEPDALLGHEWRQQGPFLVCKSCELPHALRIGMNKKLVGFDEEGKPIIEKR